MKPSSHNSKGGVRGDAFKSSRGLGTLLLVFVLLAGFVFGQMGPSTAFAIPTGSMTVTLTGPDTAQMGDTITYTLYIKADSGIFPTVNANYFLPYGVDFVSASQVSGAGLFNCVNIVNVVTCSSPLFPSGADATINIAVKVRTDVSPGLYLYNQVQVFSPPFYQDSNEVITHIPSNTAISMQGPALVMPGKNVTYQLVVKNNGAYPVPVVQLVNFFNPYLTFVSASLQNCTDQPLNASFGVNNGAPPPSGIHCELDNLAAGETRVVSLTFLANGNLGECFTNLAGIIVNGIPTFKVTKEGTLGGDTATTTLSTCFGENNTPEPPADLVAQLRVSPDRVAIDSADTDISYTLTVKNLGYGKAHQVQVKFPFDPSLTVGYATFDKPGAWVSEIGSDPANPYLVINLPDLDNNETASATVVLRPAASAATGTGEFNRFTVKWDDATLSGKSAGSNAVKFSLGDSQVNLNNGAVQLFDPAEITVPSGQTQTLTGNFFAPGELVTAWYTDANGQSLPLGTKLAGPDGTASFDFATTGLAVGDKYVVAAYGNRSGISGNSVITIGS